MTQSDPQSAAETSALGKQPEKQSKKTFSLRKTLRSVLITILSVLCIIGGVLIHKLHSKGMGTYPTFKRPETIRPAVVTQTAMWTPAAHPSVMLKSDASAPKDDGQVETTAVAPSLTADIAPEDKAQHLADDIADEFAALPQTPDEPADVSDGQTTVSDRQNESVNTTDIPDKTVAPRPTTPLRKTRAVPLNAVLKLQHDFYHTSSCRKAFDALKSKASDDLKAQQVAVDLSPFCAESGSAKKRLKALFLKDKKQVLYAYYHQSHAPWHAYIRAFLIDLIDVHEINPEGQTPPELIDRAQTAIDQGDIAGALRILTALPFELKTEFAPFFREAAAFVRAEESLKTLILSYERQGE